MSRAAPRYGCLAPGCRARAIWRGFCADHRRLSDRRPPASVRGYGARWRALRAQLLGPDSRCVQCGQRATDLHHIVPRRLGGRDEPANLVPLCRPCHSRITQAGG